MKEGDIGTYTAIYLAHLPKKDQRLIADKLVQALADNEITVRQVRALRDELLQAVALSRLVSVGGLLGRGERGRIVSYPRLGAFSGGNSPLPTVHCPALADPTQWRETRDSRRRPARVPRSG